MSIEYLSYDAQNHQNGLPCSPHEDVSEGVCECEGLHDEGRGDGDEGGQAEGAAPRGGRSCDLLPAHRLSVHCLPGLVQAGPEGGRGEEGSQ